MPAKPAKQQPGQLVAGRYRIEAELARGGVGQVCRVEDLVTKRHVALKRLLVTHHRSELVRALFEREFRTLRSLRHPRIIEVYDYGVFEGEPYYTMELLVGSDLGSLAPLQHKQAAAALRDVALSLALLETRRLVHRDVSPRNIRVMPDGRCKLLDFGALASFGVANDIVGTPPCIAPEALRGAPLDQRADLYSLGATAYYVLTGEHAHPAHSSHELSVLWSRPVPLPSQLVPGIPRALDELVMSMLNQNPLARPQSAAEVIDRLTTLAQLPAQAEQEVAASYFFGTDLVARDSALFRLSAAMDATLAGRGSTWVLEGASGSGRSRLLAEVCLRAQLASATVLQVDAARERRPGGSTCALLDRLLETGAPAIIEAAACYAEVLATATPLARSVFGERFATALPRSEIAGESRARVQAALSACIVQVAQQQPLVIAVDNLELADEGSAALFATLAAAATGCKLWLLATLRDESDAPLGAGASYVRSQAHSITLLPLTLPQTEQLARAMFGDVDNVMRLGEWMYRLSGGTPLHCFELAHELRQRGSIRYSGGTWVLPDEAEVAALPLGLSEALQARLARLSSRACELSRAVGVHATPLDLPVCLAIARAVDIDDAFATLQELVDGGVLAASGDHYQFATQALRAAVLENMSAAQRTRMHAAVAHALRLATPEDDLMARVEAGWHMLRAGDELAGARLLARSALAFETGSGSLQAAVPALEAARIVYLREGLSTYELLPIVARLASEGYFSDRRLAVSYGAEAFALLRRAAGLDLADRLSPWVGQRAAVFVGLGAAAVSFYATPRARRLSSFNEVFVLFVNCATTQAATASVCSDAQGAQEAVRFIAPLTALGKDHMICAVHEYCVQLMQMCRDDEHAVSEGFKRLLARFEDPRQLPGLPNYARLLYRGGALFALGLVATWCDGTQALERARELEALGLRIYDRAAQQIRMLYHASRADMEQAEHYRRGMELHAIQTGSAWQVEVTIPITSSIVYASLGDAAQLKLASERCEQVAERYQLASLERLALSTRAIYLLWRGGPDDLLTATEALEGVLAQVPARDFIGWGRTMGFLADAYNRAGRHLDALNTCQRALGQCTPEDRKFVRLFLVLDLQLALAEAGLGRANAAVLRLQALLEEHAAGQNPLTLGTIHEALARVAISAQDSSLFIRHAPQVDQLFRGTGVASLVARAELLARKGAEQFGFSVGLDADAIRGVVDQASIISAVSECSDDASRYQRVLELLLARARVTQGHLFVIGPTGPQLSASVGPSVPSLLLQAAAAARACSNDNRVGSETQATTIATATVAVSEAAPLFHWHYLFRAGGTRSLVGLVALSPDTAAQPLELSYLDAVASQL